MDIGHQATHDGMVRAKHRDSRRKEYEAWHDRHQGANRAQDQQGNPNDGAD